MKTWIISISSITILTSIFSIIIPNSKIGKFIKSIFSVLVIFVVISPLSAIKNQDVSFEEIINSSEIVVQNDYLDYIASKKSSELQNGSIKILKNMGVENVFVNICYKYSKSNNFVIESAEINLKNAVIISDKTHIDIKEEIKNQISNYLQIDKNCVYVNE